MKTFDSGNDKIFYLTAKNSGIDAAFTTMEMLLNHGLKAKVIQITAKDKICACLGRGCNPDECPYARGYYEKIKNAIYETFDDSLPYSKNVIISHALKNNICPFEFQLDLSLFCDVVICDFNYLFDPIVYMRRYFETETKQYVALIDEAHNLVERGRKMYSTSISYSSFKTMKKLIKRVEHKPLKSAINKINKIFKKYQEIAIEEYTKYDNIDVSFVKALSDYQKAATDYMRKFPFDVREEFKDFFFEVVKFIKISDFFDETFKYLLYKNNKDLVVNILNLDPSLLLRHSLDLLKGAVLFSATLSPLDYYVKMLGGNEYSPILQIPSPFKASNLKLMLAPNISTTFKKRNETVEMVVKYIKVCVRKKTGNYFVFFPSYKYLESVYAHFDDEFIIHRQVADMSEKEKETFLNNFTNNPTETHIGFVVLGGIFSEGIDLTNDRLIGAIIVGVGLPQISFERNLIKDYFDTHEENGFAYAYVKPGMNRVIQAVGRVIRSENDRGIALLIDERYMHRQYQELFKSEWQNYNVVFNESDIDKELDDFYNLDD